jgi:hypothetical protein
MDKEKPQNHKKWQIAYSVVIAVLVLVIVCLYVLTQYFK